MLDLQERSKDIMYSVIPNYAMIQRLEMKAQGKSSTVSEWQWAGIDYKCINVSFLFVPIGNLSIWKEIGSG